MAPSVRERPDAWWYHRVVGHAHAAARLRAGGQTRTAFGWMVEHPAAPWLRAVNRAQVQPGAGGLPPADLVAAVVDEHERRRLRAMVLDVRNVEDARVLGPALRAAGWEPEELAVLAARPAAVRSGAAGLVAGTFTVAAEPPDAAVEVRRSAGRTELAGLAATERERVATQWVHVPAPDVMHLLARTADADRTPVGAAVLHLGATHVEVDDLVVVPDRRGTGAGTAILDAAAAIAAQRGAGRIGLLARRGSRPLRWYRRLGLVDLGSTATATREPRAG